MTSMIQYIYLFILFLWPLIMCSSEWSSPTSCTFCRSATMFVRSFCSFSSASLSLTSLLLLFSSTALARASALLWYELHNDWRPDSYCWKYSFYKERENKFIQKINTLDQVQVQVNMMRHYFSVYLIAGCCYWVLNHFDSD